MNTFISGLGDVAIQSTAVAKPNVLDKISSVLTNVVKPAADIYTQVKTGQQSQPSGTVVSNPTMYPQPMPTTPPPPATEPDNTKKYLIIGGVGLGAAALIFFMTRKKK